MTIIIGAANGKQVWMGSDSRCTAGWEIVEMGDRKKLFRRGKLIFGMAGASSTCDTINQSLVLPAGSSKQNPITYLNDILAPAIRKCLDDHKQAMVMGDFSAGIVLGMAGEIYYGNSDLFFRIIHERLFCIGSAGYNVEGSFRAFRSVGMPIEDAMIKAMELTGQRNLSIGPPYYVEKMG